MKKCAHLNCKQMIADIAEFCPDGHRQDDKEQFGEMLGDILGGNFERLKRKIESEN